MNIWRTRFMLLTTAMITCTAHAGIYVSVDSIQPTTDRQLAMAQIEATRAQTDSLVRSAQSNEFIMQNMLEFSQAQQTRADAKLDEIVRQRLVLDVKREDLLNQQNALLTDKKQLEQDRIVMQATHQAREEALNRRNAITQRTMFDEQRDREQAFFKKATDIQNQSLALQRQVAHASDDLLAAQLKLNAPSNVVVASKDASNFTAKVKPNDVGEMGKLSKTSTKPPLVNMNTFIESIIPKGWRYYPPTDSASKKIPLVQGKDWKSIINQIAVQHPYIEFQIDPYAKVLTAREMYQPQTPRKNSNVVRAWHINPTRSLRETIEHFAAQSGWDVYWDTKDIDYPIVASATITADFSGKNGIVNRLMKSTQSEDFPLFAVWKEQNGVVVIQRRGSTKR